MNAQNARLKIRRQGNSVSNVEQNSFKDRAHLEKADAIFAEIGTESDRQEARKLLEMRPT